MTNGGNWKDLVKAADEGNAAIVRYHLRNSIDPNFQHPEFFSTPLGHAIRAGHLEIVKILVEGGSDPDLMEEMSDERPVDMALTQKHHKIVDYLNSILPEKRKRKVHNIVVTGANRGIGQAIARQLLDAGHRVLVVCRTAEKAETTVADLAQETGNDKVSFVVGDLGSIASSRDVASKIKESFPNLDRLVLNAGVWPVEKTINADGLEVGFVVNYLSQYILCDALLPLIQANPPSRIVFVSAGLYSMGKADIEKTPAGKDFSVLRTYASTKQCGVMLMSRLARQVDGTSVTVNAVHPGVIQTDLGSTGGICGGLLRFVKYFWKSPEYGAVEPCRLALDQELQQTNGKFFFEREEIALTESVSSVSAQEQWLQWTKDFLAKAAHHPKL
jgi:NAD(P)-dependent dehydrogenase (short-subunit alcohol dehydrogenase family)